MNAFVEHHKHSIQFGYRCFDRLLLNGLIQPFQQPERVLGFFNTYRDGKRVTRRTLTEIADQFQYWLKNHSEKWGAPILEPPDGTGDDSRRDKFLDPYFENAKPNQVVAILKAREPARILVAIGDKDNDSPHLEYKQRWVNQFNFYLNDTHWGRMFVRMCPYFPFSARVCLNQHHWLAIRMREEGIDFQQCTNAFLKCGNPARLQELADSLTPQDLLRCGQKWLAAFTPFISDRERKHAGCQHRLFFSQVEYCDNLIFHRRAAVDELTERLLDLNRTIGQPKKITMIFGRKVTKQYKGKLQTVIEDLDLPNPVIRSHYGHGFAKQYVRDDREFPVSVRDCGLSLADRLCRGREAWRYDTGIGKPSRGCGAVGAAICGVSQYAPGAVAAAGGVVGCGGEVGAAGWDRSYGAGVGCGPAESTEVDGSISSLACRSRGVSLDDSVELAEQ